MVENDGGQRRRRGWASSRSKGVRAGFGRRRARHSATTSQPSPLLPASSDHHHDHLGRRFPPLTPPPTPMAPSPASGDFTPATRSSLRNAVAALEGLQMSSPVASSGNASGLTSQVVSETTSPNSETDIGKRSKLDRHLSVGGLEAPQASPFFGASSGLFVPSRPVSLVVVIGPHLVVGLMAARLVLARVWFDAILLFFPSFSPTASPSLTGAPSLAGRTREPQPGHPPSLASATPVRPRRSLSQELELVVSLCAHEGRSSVSWC